MFETDSELSIESPEVIVNIALNKMSAPSSKDNEFHCDRKYLPFPYVNTDFDALVTYLDDE